MFPVLNGGPVRITRESVFGSEHLLTLWLLSLVLEGKFGTTFRTFNLLSSSVSSVPSAMTIWK